MRFAVGLLGVVSAFVGSSAAVDNKLALTPAEAACNPAMHQNGPGDWKPNSPVSVSDAFALSPSGQAKTVDGVTVWIKYRDYSDSSGQHREYKLIGINRSSEKRSVSFTFIDKGQPTVIPILYFRNELNPGQTRTVCDVWNVDPAHPVQQSHQMQVDP